MVLTYLEAAKMKFQIYYCIRNKFLADRKNFYDLEGGML